MTKSLQGREKLTNSPTYKQPNQRLGLRQEKRRTGTAGIHQREEKEGRGGDYKASSHSKIEL